MTVALPQARPQTVRDSASVYRRAGDEPTFERVVSGVWEELVAGRTVGCPVCGSGMAPTRRGTLSPAEGGCEGCGSTLS
jgi:hypothetical protein